MSGASPLEAGCINVRSRCVHACRESSNKVGVTHSQRRILCTIFLVRDALNIESYIPPDKVLANRGHEWARLPLCCPKITVAREQEELEINQTKIYARHIVPLAILPQLLC